MANKNRPPATHSDVTVVFIDGEVKTYRISAGIGIGGYLAREAGASGVLSLFNGEQSWGIPLAQIRRWSIVAVKPGKSPAAESTPSDSSAQEEPSP